MAKTKAISIRADKDREIIRDALNLAYDDRLAYARSVKGCAGFEHNYAEATIEAKRYRAMLDKYFGEEPNSKIAENSERISLFELAKQNR